MSRDVEAPAVLGVEAAIPVPLVAVGAVRRLGVGREDSEQPVGVAVTRAERVVGVVAEVVQAGIVGRPGSILESRSISNAELEVVPAAASTTGRSEACTAGSGSTSAAALSCRPGASGIQACAVTARVAQCGRYGHSSLFVFFCDGLAVLAKRLDARREEARLVRERVDDVRLPPLRVVTRLSPPCPPGSPSG